MLDLELLEKEVAERGLAVVYIYRAISVDKKKGNTYITYQP